MKLRIEIIIIVINLIIIVQLSDGKRCRDLLVGQHPFQFSKSKFQKNCICESHFMFAAIALVNTAVWIRDSPK